MSVEIELKFMLLPTAIDAVTAHLAAQAQQGAKRRHLDNRYYETTDNTLRRQGMGLRIRGCDQQYEMTLKCEGDSLGGLSQRPEYNVQLTQPSLDLTLLPVEIWRLECDIHQLQQRLQPLFSTDFVRESYLIPYGNSTIEAALDQGHICAGQRSEPLLELELELLQGSGPDLLAFAWQLHTLTGLRMATRSKAARGYALAAGADIRASVPETPSLSATMPLAQGVVQVLSYVQQCWYQQIEVGLTTGAPLQETLAAVMNQIEP
ncbi:MAG: inorganic triphosphatase, partial [Enterobacteriaceae bacterium]